MTELKRNGQRNSFTRRLIEEYIQVGMNVLDVGCGTGEISFFLAEAVGNTGNVFGIDVNRSAIEAALERKKESGKRNISFSATDLNELVSGQYDAIFGRRILMYQPDPLDTIQTLKRVLKPGGIMLFQESDEMGNLLNGDHFPVHNMVQEWIWETVRREGGNTHMGSELYKVMKAADLSVVDYRSEAMLQTIETGSDLAWVVCMMQMRMKALGIQADTEKLEDRLREELQNADHAFVRDMAFAICAKK